MTHDDITTYFQVSLVSGLLVGVPIFLLWLRRIWPKLIKRVEGRRIRETATLTFIWLMPGTLLFILCLVPTFYFNHLLKQEEYCKQVVRVNKDMDENDPFYQERCGCLDAEEIFEARNTP